MKRSGNLQDNYPEIAKEWHPTRNGELTPAQVTPASNKKVWWKGSQGHEWEAILQITGKMELVVQIATGNARAL